MATAEQPLVVGASRWIAIVPTAAFGAATVGLAPNGLSDGHHWLGFGVSAVVTFVCAAAIIVHPRLEIGAITITRIDPFSRRTYELRRCGRFHAEHYWGRGARWVVEFNYGDPRRGPRRRGNSHFECYGQEARELAALLNTARDHAKRV